MDETTSVWIVEQGSYSDYRVVAIFADQATAATFALAASDPHDEASVREVPLLTAMPKRVPWHGARVERSGRKSQWSGNRWDFEPEPGGGNGTGFGRTPGAALKAAQDSAAQVAADRAGLTR